MKKEFIRVVMQAFYGNRTIIEVEDEDIDYMLQGIMDKSLISLDYQPDRTIIRIPESDCVIVYNKYQEEAKLKRNEVFKLKDGYEAKPLSSIPELGIQLYSRCFMCRINESGELEDIQTEDMEFMTKYLAQ